MSMCPVSSATVHAISSRWHLSKSRWLLVARGPEHEPTDPAGEAELTLYAGQGSHQSHVIVVWAVERIKTGVRTAIVTLLADSIYARPHSDDCCLCGASSGDLVVTSTFPLNLGWPPKT